MGVTKLRQSHDGKQGKGLSRGRRVAYLGGFSGEVSFVLLGRRWKLLRLLLLLIAYLVFPSGLSGSDDVSPDDDDDAAPKGDHGRRGWGLVGEAPQLP